MTVRDKSNTAISLNSNSFFLLTGENLLNVYYTDLIATIGPDI